jgi:hypothetical protein
MTRLCKAASWFCNCLAVALLLVGILAVPELARADGGKTCEDFCAGNPNYSTCMQTCYGITIRPCGGRVWTQDNCVATSSPCLLLNDPDCPDTPGCRPWLPPETCPCACKAPTVLGGPCGCY